MMNSRSEQPGMSADCSARKSFVHRYQFAVAIILMLGIASLPTYARAASALWYGSNFDTVHNQPGDDVAAIPSAQLKKSGAPERVKITEPILTNAMGVAFNRGNLWVTAESDHVYEFQKSQLKHLSSTPTPTPAVDITSPEFQFILGCAFDHQGNLWVVDSEFNGIHEFSAAQLAAGSGDIAPTVDITSPSFESPAFATFDRKGNLWVSSTDNSTLAEFDKSHIGSSGNLTPDILIQSSSVNEPGQIQFDHRGNLWVPNAGNNTVVEFTKAQIAASGGPTAAVILSSTTINGDNTIDVPWGMAFDNGGNLWVYNYIADASQTHGSVAKFTPKLLKTTGAPTPPVFLTGLPPYSGEFAFGTPPK